MCPGSDTVYVEAHCTKRINLDEDNKPLRTRTKGILWQQEVQEPTGNRWMDCKDYNSQHDVDGHEF